MRIHPQDGPYLVSIDGQVFKVHVTPMGMTWVFSIGLFTVTFTWEWTPHENGPYLTPVGLATYVGFCAFHDHQGRFEVYGPAVGEDSAWGTYAPL